VYEEETRKETALPDFKAFFEQLPGLYMVLDKSLRIVAASDAYLRATKRSRSDIGRCVFDVFPDNPDDPSSDAVANSTASFNRVLRSGTTDAMVVQRHDIRRSDEEGGGFETRYWSPVNSPIFERDSSVGYVLHRVEDVTELVRLREEGAGKAEVNDELRDRVLRMEADLYVRSREVAESSLRLKQANEELGRLYETDRQESEARLRTSEERFRIAQELSPDGFTIIRPVRDDFGQVVDFTWVYENPTIARLNGTDPDIVIGRRLSEFMPGHSSSVFHDAYRRVAETGRPEVVEFSYHGDTIEKLTWFRTVVVPMGNDIAILSQDITDRKVAEETLRKSEESFRTTVASIGDAVITTDGEGRVTFLNRVAEAATGWTLPEASGKLLDEVFRIINEKTREKTESPVGRVLREGKIVGLANHTVLISRDGKEFAIDDTAAPIRNTEGETTGVVLVFHDVTERRRAEEALRTSEERFRSVLGNTRDAIIRVNLQTGRYEYASPSVETLIGYSATELMTIDTETVLLTTVHPDDLPALRAADALSLETGHADVEYRQWTRKGEYIWVSNRMSVSRDSSGRPLYRTVVLRDITGQKAAEEALRRQADLIDLSYEAMFVWEIDGPIVSWNKGASRLYGFNEKETVGLRSHDLLETRFPGSLEETLSALKRQGRFSGELLHRRKDGTVITVESRMQLIRDSSGRDVVLEINRDTTERKAVEEALRASEERFRSVVESMSEGLMMFDSAGNLIYQNPASLRIHGFEAGGDGQIGHDDLAATWDAWDDTGRPIVFDEWPVSRVFRHERFQEQVLRVVRPETGYEFFGSYNGSPIYDSDGNLALGFITIRDITGRKKAEEALRASEARARGQAAHLQAILDAAPAIIWIARDSECRSITGNRTAHEFLRVTRDTDMSKSGPAAERLRHYHVFKDGVELSVEEMPLQRVAATGGELVDYEMEIVFDDGTRNFLLGNVTPIFDESGRPDGAVAAFVDVTGLKETQKELESFAYTISHDLRAPLRAINGFAVMLAHALPLADDEAKRKLRAIETNALKMGQLIDDLLAFSRAGRTAMSVTEVDMNRMVGEVLDLLKAGREDRPGVRVMPLPPAFGDPALVRQVLTNLLSNAVKFSGREAEPAIEIGALREGNDYVYYVKDNGIGFDMKFYGNLFGVFQRLVTDEEFEGTGVGLAIVRRVIARHGGRVWAEGKPGEGAAFYFTLPGKG
jgi:PAS domain S-box-containing protein